MRTRRLFLQQTSAAALLTALYGTRNALAATAPRPGLFDSQNLFPYTHGQMTEAAFRGQIGRDFNVVLADGTRGTLRLREVNALAQRKAVAAGAVNTPTVRAARSAAPALSGFEATFKVRDSFALEQDSYTVESPIYGPMVLFLVPSPVDGAPRTCTASFLTLG